MINIGQVLIKDVHGLLTALRAKMESSTSFRERLPENTSQIRSKQNETDFTQGSYQHLITDQYDLSKLTSPEINERHL
ncbi:hypothetical protein EG68_00686 [Paragonimus skrjabini miyazakii]|uniref:Uncharacterized protein n=1 Tax=Paragonimus skrjabini miyazakii TaxID=59628 RepID=A0A8S9ZCL1_9TREM|nr:hypothetical protein EG68_00686 [Paragonimus skrjabini miyazakii]